MIRQREGPALRRQQDTPGPEASEQQQLRVTQGHALVVAPAPASVERRHQLGTCLIGEVPQRRDDRRRAGVHERACHAEHAVAGHRTLRGSTRAQHHEICVKLEIIDVRGGEAAVGGRVTSVAAEREK